MAFNYYYDFEDCFQMSGGTGTTLTYVVGSNDVLNLGDVYTIFNVTNPNQKFCSTNLTASTSTAATYYSGVLNQYDDCDICLSANTNVITITGFTTLNNGNSVTLVADNKYIKGDRTQQLLQRHIHQAQVRG